MLLQRRAMLAARGGGPASSLAPLGPPPPPADGLAAVQALLFPDSLADSRAASPVDSIAAPAFEDDGSTDERPKGRAWPFGVEPFSWLHDGHVPGGAAADHVLDHSLLYRGRGGRVWDYAAREGGDEDGMHGAATTSSGTRSSIDARPAAADTAAAVVEVFYRGRGGHVWEYSRDSSDGLYGSSSGSSASDAAAAAIEADSISGGAELSRDASFAPLHTSAGEPDSLYGMHGRQSASEDSLESLSPLQPGDGGLTDPRHSGGGGGSASAAQPRPPQPGGGRVAREPPPPVVQPAGAVLPRDAPPAAVIRRDLRGGVLTYSDAAAATAPTASRNSSVLEEGRGYTQHETPEAVVATRDGDMLAYPSLFEQQQQQQQQRVVAPIGGTLQPVASTLRAFSSEHRERPADGAHPTVFSALPANARPVEDLRRETRDVAVHADTDPAVARARPGDERGGGTGTGVRGALAVVSGGRDRGGGAGLERRAVVPHLSTDLQWPLPPSECEGGVLEAKVALVARPPQSAGIPAPDRRPGFPARDSRDKRATAGRGREISGAPPPRRAVTLATPTLYAYVPQQHGIGGPGGVSFASDGAPAARAPVAVLPVPALARSLAGATNAASAAHRVEPAPQPVGSGVTKLPVSVATGDARTGQRRDVRRTQGAAAAGQLAVPVPTPSGVLPSAQAAGSSDVRSGGSVPLAAAPAPPVAAAPTQARDASSAPGAPPPLDDGKSGATAPPAASPPAAHKAESAWSMVRQRVARLRELFHAVDVDGGGTISRIELIRALRTRPDVAALLHLPEHIRQEDGTRDAFERVFQAIDRDCSKSITFEELLAYVTEHGPTTWAAVMGTAQRGAAAGSQPVGATQAHATHTESAQAAAARTAVGGGVGGTVATEGAALDRNATVPPRLAGDALVMALDDDAVQRGLGARSRVQALFSLLPLDSSGCVSRDDLAAALRGNPMLVGSLGVSDLGAPSGGSGGSSAVMPLLADAVAAAVARDLGSTIALSDLEAYAGIDSGGALAAAPAAATGSAPPANFDLLRRRLRVVFPLETHLPVHAAPRTTPAMVDGRSKSTVTSAPRDTGEIAPGAAAQPRDSKWRLVRSNLGRFRALFSTLPADESGRVPRHELALALRENPVLVASLGLHDADAAVHEGSSSGGGGGGSTGRSVSAEAIAAAVATAVANDLPSHVTLAEFADYCGAEQLGGGSGGASGTRSWGLLRRRLQVAVSRVRALAAPAPVGPGGAANSLPLPDRDSDASGGGGSGDEVAGDTVAAAAAAAAATERDASLHSAAPDSKWQTVRSRLGHIRALFASLPVDESGFVARSVLSAALRDNSSLVASLQLRDSAGAGPREVHPGTAAHEARVVAAAVETDLGPSVSPAEFAAYAGIDAGGVPQFVAQAQLRGLLRTRLRAESEVARGGGGASEPLVVAPAAPHHGAPVGVQSRALVAAPSAAPAPVLDRVRALFAVLGAEGGDRLPRRVLASSLLENPVLLSSLGIRDIDVSSSSSSTSGSLGAAVAAAIECDLADSVGVADFAVYCGGSDVAGASAGAVSTLLSQERGRLHQTLRRRGEEAASTAPGGGHASAGPAAAAATALPPASSHAAASEYHHAGRSYWSTVRQRVSLLHELFESVDRDHSGTISRIELIRALRTRPDVAALLHLPEHIRQEDGTRDAFERVFQAIDRDCSKSITFEELLAYVTEHGPTTWADVLQAGQQHGAPARVQSDAPVHAPAVAAAARDAFFPDAALPPPLLRGAGAPDSLPPSRENDGSVAIADGALQRPPHPDRGVLSSAALPPPLLRGAGALGTLPPSRENDGSVAITDGALQRPAQPDRGVASSAAGSIDVLPSMLRVDSRGSTRGEAAAAAAALSVTPIVPLSEDARSDGGVREIARGGRSGAIEAAKGGGAIEATRSGGGGGGGGGGASDAVRGGGAREASRVGGSSEAIRGGGGCGASDDVRGGGGGSGGGAIDAARGGGGGGGASDAVRGGGGGGGASETARGGGGASDHAHGVGMSVPIVAQDGAVTSVSSATSGDGGGGVFAASTAPREAEAVRDVLSGMPRLTDRLCAAVEELTREIASSRVSSGAAAAAAIGPIFAPDYEPYFRDAGPAAAPGAPTRGAAVSTSRVRAHHDSGGDAHIGHDAGGAVSGALRVDRGVGDGPVAVDRDDSTAGPLRITVPCGGNGSVTMSLDRDTFVTDVVDGGGTTLRAARTHGGGVNVDVRPGGGSVPRDVVVGGSSGVEAGGGGGSNAEVRPGGALRAGVGNSGVPVVGGGSGGGGGGGGGGGVARDMTQLHSGFLLGMPHQQSHAVDSSSRAMHDAVRFVPTTQQVQPRCDVCSSSRQVTPPAEDVWDSVWSLRPPPLPRQMMYAGRDDFDACVRSTLEAIARAEAMVRVHRPSCRS